jgi:shikimate dehydrogenase
MKNYLVIGNPIEHSLSPKLHNYWIRENNIDAVYNKKQLNENDIKGTISEVADGKIDGINVTIPFKKSVIPFLNELTPLAKEAQSVNTIYKKNGKLVGDNTDVGGFERALKHINYNVQGKKIFILGAGGVVSSIILTLKKAKASEIVLSNRTKKKAENLKKKYSYLKIVNWGDVPDSNMIINATSLGLKEDDEIKLNYADIKPNKLFYDIIYNPSETKFLSRAKQFGNQIENGKAMFAYQAQLAFEIWHGIKPTVDKKILKLLDND